MIEIRPATPTDRPGIVALLNASDLPLEGLDEALEAAVVARRGDTLIACAALELYGDAALLRSVAVAPDHRGEGLGQKITEGALAVARQRGVRRIYLLTETADRFFPRFGFRRIARDQVEPAARQSVEFRSVCPESAVVMVHDSGARPITVTHRP
jgi:amino-acid N-acetyltransferase